MNRAFAAACLLLVATACGTATTLSNGQARALPVKEWCAQYRDITTSIRPDQEPPALDGPEFRAILDKLRGLAEQAPAEIRDDLRAMWTTPDDPLNPPAPTGPQTTPGIPDQLPEQAMRPFRWINDNCGDEPFTGPSGADGIPTDFPENRPVGDWQAAQRGTVGPSTWTFFRTGASDGGVCVAFEADPSYLDWEARIRAQAPIQAGTPFPPIAPPGLSAPPGIPSAPPSIPLPPVGPPPVPADLGIAYQGKLPQCGPAPDLFQRSDPVMFWVTDQDPTNHYNVLAGLVVAETRSLTVTFQDGHQQVVTPVDGTFVVTYDAKRRIAKVVPDLGPESHVTCGPLPQDAMPAGVPDFLSMSCQGSTSRSGMPVPPFGLPKR